MARLKREYSHGQRYHVVQANSLNSVEGPGSNLDQEQDISSILEKSGT